MQNGGISIVEILVSLGIIVVLATLFAGVAKRILQESRNAGCVNNLRQISAASFAYSADHNGEWPANFVHPTDPYQNIVFSESLSSYLPAYPRWPSGDFRKSPLVCPADKVPHTAGNPDVGYTVFRYGLSYGQNQSLNSTLRDSSAGIRRQLVKHPSELALYMDFTGHFEMNASRLKVNSSIPNKTRLDLLKERHNGKGNVAFADGSIRPVDLDTLSIPSPSLFWQGRTE